MFKKVNFFRYSLPALLLLFSLYIFNLAYGNTLLASDHLATDLANSCQHQISGDVVAAIPTSIVNFSTPTFFTLDTYALPTVDSLSPTEQSINNKSPPIIT